LTRNADSAFSYRTKKRLLLKTNGYLEGWVPEGARLFILTLALLGLTASRTAAAILTIDPATNCIGNTINITVTDYCVDQHLVNNPSTIYVWDSHDNQYMLYQDGQSGSTYVANSVMTGSYIYDASVLFWVDGDYRGTAYFIQWIVHVTGLLKSPDRSAICPAEPITFTATLTPTTNDTTLACLSWGGDVSASTPTQSITTNWATPGLRVATVADGYNSYSQSVTVVKLTLDSVTFSGGLEVKQDNGDSYPTNHWTSGGNRSPYLYVAGTTNAMAGSFTVEPTSFGETVYVTASGEGFQWPTNSVSPSAGSASFASTMALSGSPTTVGYNSNATYVWNYSCSSTGPVFAIAGTNKNPIYVSLASPSVTLRTVVHTACAGISATNGEQAFNAIWTKFASKSLQAWDDQTPLYYHHPETLNDTVDKLMTDHNGNCDAWVDFLKKALAIQGFTATTNVTAYPKSGLQHVYFSARANTAGQNNPNPSTGPFRHHIMLLKGNRIYDPSYGRVWGMGASYTESCYHFDDNFLDYSWGESDNTPFRCTIHGYPVDNHRDNTLELDYDPQPPDP
jgi:hypothetical protein